MEELRLTEYREGEYLWLPKGARILGVREQGPGMASYIWTVLEKASPIEKTLRRFVVLEVHDVYRLKSNERLQYIGTIGTEADARAILEICALPKAEQTGGTISFYQA